MEFTLDGCNGFATEFAWPGPNGPGDAPPGWNDTFPAGGLGSSEFVWLIECARLAWGPFDQPVTIYLEAHDKVDEPTTCPDGAFNALQSIWTDSPEVSAFLAEHYNLPTRTGQFQATFDGSTGSQSWTWRESGEASSLTLVRAEPESPATQGLSQIFAWDNGAGVSLVYFEPRTLPLHASVATGAFKEPTLHATAGVEAWSGRARPFASEPFDGTIVEYDDYECREPRADAESDDGLP